MCSSAYYAQVLEKRYVKNTKKLINEVRQFPEIYNPQLNVRNTKSFRLDAWEQVCRAMVPYWDELSYKDQFIHGTTMIFI